MVSEVPNIFILSTCLWKVGRAGEEEKVISCWKQKNLACSMLSLNSDLICCFYLLNLPPSLVILSMRSGKSLLTTGTWSSFLPSITFDFMSRQSNAPSLNLRRRWGIPIYSAARKHLSGDFSLVIGLVLGYFVSSMGFCFVWSSLFGCDAVCRLNLCKNIRGSRCNVESLCWTGDDKNKNDIYLRFYLRRKAQILRNVSNSFY